MCAKVCPYSAIANRTRPCQKACKVKSIEMGPSHEAVINNDNCTRCGACVYQCPFGAINDKSWIVDVIKMIQASNENKDYKVYAIVAPSIASQYLPKTLRQVLTTLMQQVGCIPTLKNGVLGYLDFQKEAEPFSSEVDYTVNKIRCQL